MTRVYICPAITFVLLLLFKDNKSKVIQQDVDVLQDIYLATNGSNWSHQWNITSLYNGNICGLYGVTCNPTKSRIKKLELRINSLSGTIPLSIGNLTALNTLNLEANMLFGTIPHTLCNLLKLQRLRLPSNHISGTIPSSIGKLSSLKFLSLEVNYLSGTIPSSIGNLSLLEGLGLATNSLSGTIPSSIGNLPLLTSLDLTNNSLSGTIPPSIGNLTSLTSLFISFNSLSGTIPSEFGNLTVLGILNLANNLYLSGTIPLGLSYLPKLRSIDLSNNSLYSSNITKILSNWFNPTIGTVPMLISISNNVNLYGDLSELEYLGDIYLNITTQYFAAHHCDLYGSFPNNIHFVGQQNILHFKDWSNFVIHNNRLSCDIPKHLLMSSFFNSSNIIIPSNLFQIKHSDMIPKWVTSSFKTATLLYYTQSDETISYIFAILTVLCIIIFIIKKIRQIWNEKAFEILVPQSVYTNKITPFLDSILVLKKHLNDIKLILIPIPFLIFYYFNSSYFKCSLILSQLSLSYYIGYNIWCDWILTVILLPVLYVIIWHFIIKSQKEQLEQNKQVKYKHKQNDHEAIDDHNDNSNKIRKIGWFVLFLFLFLFSTIFVILSMIFESLPEHNKFNLSSLSMKYIQILMPVILTINAAIIIPNFVDSTYNVINLCIRMSSLSYSTFICKYRPLIILIFRTLSTIIIPFISAMVLLQNCGKNWTYFWKECNDKLRNQFDIVLINIVTSYIPISLLTSDEVCSPKSIYNIEWNKCIRTFYANWSFVIIQKLFIMVILPIFIVFSKEFQKKIAAKYVFCKKNFEKNIGIDMEYSMVLTKCESMIIWGAISPFVIILTILSINVNYFFYHKMINEREWKIHPIDNNIIFPIYILWISIFVSQFFLCLFIFVCIQNKYCGYTLLTMLIIIDMIFIIHYMRYKMKTISAKGQGLINQQ